MARGTVSLVLRRELGSRIRAYRLHRQLSQEELAWAAEVTQGAISNYENGRHEMPLSVLISVCAALEVAPVELVPILERVPGEGPGPLAWSGLTSLRTPPVQFVGA